MPTPPTPAYHHSAAKSLSPHAARHPFGLCLALSVALLLPCISAQAQTYSWTNFAALPGGIGNVDGTGSAARFNAPLGVAVDSSGNVYVADQTNNTIRKITSSAVVTTLAGSAGNAGSTNGTGSSARFNSPQGVAVDGSGNVYVADGGNSTIRKITNSGVVSTLAGSAGQTGSTDGTGSSARFNYPTGVAVDGSGNVYVADYFNQTIRKITSGGVVSTLAGSTGQTGTTDGTGSAARFNYPTGVAVDASGNVYVADRFNQTIRKITGAGLVTTLAGSAGSTGSADGTGSAARFNYPAGVAADSSGNVYVADGNSTIRKITSAGVVTTLAGSAGSTGSADGTGSAARFYYPYGVAVDASSNVYVADTNNETIRKISSGGAVTTLAGSTYSAGNADGTGSAARFNYPTGVAADSSGNVYIADQSNATIRKISSAGVVTTLAGTAGSIGFADGTGSAAQFNQPTGVAVDGSGNVYVADTYNQTIRKITSGGVVTTLAGSAGHGGSTDGTGSAARFLYPSGVAVDGSGNIYVADKSNCTIRKITSGGVVTTLAGQAGQAGSADGTGSAARFYAPSGVAVDGSGNVYVADQGAGTIRKITSSGAVTTLAGLAGNSGSVDSTGIFARFFLPTGVAVDGNGNVYVADTDNCTIRKITSGGSVSTIGGTPGVASGANGVGAAAQFSYPQGVAVGANGFLFIADTSNNRISVGMALPLVALGSATGIGTSAATLNGSVNPGGSATTAQFQYGLTTSYTNTAAVNLSPNDGSTSQNVSAAIGGLQPNTQYHYRLTASNASGMASAEDKIFTTLSPLQQWRLTYFGTMTNSGNAADTADPYGTGISNLDAFAFFGPNQDPAQAQISLLPQAQTGGSNLFFSFNQPAGVSGIAYGAQWSTTLQANDWHAITDTGNGNAHLFNVPVGGNAKLFIRLEVSEP